MKKVRFTPETLEKGTQWLTLRLKNAGDDSLHNLGIKMHSTDSLQISFRGPSDYIYRKASRLVEQKLEALMAAVTT
jgi:hypothetical protein